MSAEIVSWWCHQMVAFSALLSICSGNSPVTSEFPTQRPVTRSCDFFYMRLNERSSKQLCDWCSETPSRPLWRHCNIMILRVLNASNLFDLSSFLTAVGLEGSLICILPEENVYYIDAAFGLTIRRSLILNVTVHSSGAMATGSLAKMV